MGRNMLDEICTYSFSDKLKKRNTYMVRKNSKFWEEKNGSNPTILMLSSQASILMLPANCYCPNASILMLPSNQ